jgi:hypothetical protein
MDTIRKFFNLWRQAVDFALYDKWCEENADQLVRESVEFFSV